MNANEDLADSIHETTMLPDLLRAAPQVRPVLDRYGLRGCGGEYGPMETLGFFARAHDVPLELLLTEIRTALRPAAPSPPGPETPQDHVADTIYAPFFKSGIAVVLTLGGAWGAFLLVRIALAGSFTSVGIQEVNAHGHAQIFGWVGLFVMGFAYQAFPRFKHSTLSHPKLALATLWIMLSGIVLRSTSQALLPYMPHTLVTGLLGSILEVTAICAFAGIIWRTLRDSGKALAFYDYYILCALGWFAFQAMFGTVYFAATALAPNRDALLALVSTWQGPLRDMQIHGFALLMILGVSQRIFHHFYGFKAPDPRTGIRALFGINAAVAGEIVGFVLMRTQGLAWTALWYGSVLLLFGTLLRLVLGWGLLAVPQETDRALKFLRTAYVWLFISFAMLVLLPVYQFGILKTFAPGSEAARIGFSHAYYGAIRHAITVGFISLMIVGVAAKVVPTLKGVDVRALPALWVPFLLLNVGCAMRVGLQTLTDFTPAAYPLAGVSGILEVAGLAIWGVHLLRIMGDRYGEATARSAAPALEPGRPITAETVVADALRVYPETLDTFLAFGFRPLANALVRKRMASSITVGGAARLAGIPGSDLVEALNRARGTRQSPLNSLEATPAPR